jgi:hypothetical protein
MTLALHTRTYSPAADAAEHTRATTVHAEVARHIASCETPEHCPAGGAVALDLMASIAGAPWAPGHERAWSTAFEIVAGALVEHDLSGPAIPDPGACTPRRRQPREGRRVCRAKDDARPRAA